MSSSANKLSGLKASVPRTYSEWYSAASAAHWLDGLPVYPAEEEQVARLLNATDRAPGEVLGVVPPALATATVGAVAVQAAMAGCPPAAFPVVLAAVRAMLDETTDVVGPGFNLEGIQATACSCAPMVIVSPNAALQLGMEYRCAALASEGAVNAPIGRTVRLVMWNIGGGRPGETDMSVIGNPGKYGWSVAEHPLSPWEPLHVSRGLPRIMDAVTMFACDSPHEVALGHEIRSPLEVVTRIANTVCQAGSLNMYWGGQALIVLNLNLARAFAAEGWGRSDIAGCLYELARRTPAECNDFYDAKMMQFFDRPAWSSMLRTVPAVFGPRDLHIVVTGEGEGAAAAVCPGWGAAGGHAMTVPLPSVRKPEPFLGQSEEVSGYIADADPLLSNVAADDALGVRSSIRKARRRPGVPLRVLLFGNYAQADGSAGGVMQWLERHLRMQSSVIDVTWYSSQVPTRREPVESLQRLATLCDAVVLGVGLSGSRSWKIAIDAVQFEKSGLPTVLVVTRGYEEYIGNLARAAAFTDALSMVVIEPTDPPLETGHSLKLVEAILSALQGI